jgi:phospholipid/cholesterol/gamma-HCH transport system permease protein
MQMLQAGILQFFSEIGGITRFLLSIERAFRTTRGNAPAIFAQIVHVCFRSLPTIAFSGIFVGAILVIQFRQILVEYNAEVFLGGLNTSAVIREVGPLIISFLLAGKIGAYTAAELGTMRVTEQIDAIECLGTNPIQYLIVPRFLGIVISSLILLSLGLMISICGSMFVAHVLYDINPLQFVSAIPQFSSPTTLISGFVKSFIFGTLVAGVACYKGYTASGGARGVGKAVTLAAIYTNVFIVIADYASSQVLGALFQLLSHMWGEGA